MTRVSPWSSLPAVCLLLLACSEGPGVIPRGGANFTLGSTSNAPSGKTCPSFGYTVEIGDPPPQRTRTDEGGTLADGEKETDVRCASRGTDEVTFSAYIKGRNRDGRFGEINFRNGVIGSDGKGTASAIVSAPPDSTSVAITLTSEEDCYIEGVTTSAGQMYGDGKLWARFYCDAMTGGVNYFCKTEGVVVFEYCDR